MIGSISGGSPPPPPPRRNRSVLGFYALDDLTRTHKPRQMDAADLRHNWHCAPQTLPLDIIDDSTGSFSETTGENLVDGGSCPQQKIRR
jgi:hypothetical protein